MILKKIFVVVATVGAIMSSCSDYLDIVPDGTGSIDNAFVDKFNAEKFLFTCYSYLPKMANTDKNPALIGSDEMSMSLLHQDYRGLRLSNGYQSIVDPLYNYWNGSQGGTPMYTGIRDCNILLERIDGVPDMTEYEKNRWKAEVKFIKAYLHFYLIRMYGPIHIIRENLDITESIENLKLSRDPIEECFSYVIELLDEAINTVELPEYIENKTLEHGRITSVIAKSVKAQVLVTAASPLFNGESGFQIQNKDGVQLFPENDPVHIIKKWEVAENACKEAISAITENGFRLLEIQDFKESGIVSDTTKLKVILGYRVSLRDKNTEVIWPHTNSVVSGLQGAVMPPYFQILDYHANGNIGVPHKIALQYYTNHGIPIEQDKEWDGVNLISLQNGDDDHKYHLKLGRKTVRQNFHREPRFYSDLLFDGALVYGHLRHYSSDQNNKLDYINHLQGGHSSAGFPSRYCPLGYWPHKWISIETGEAGHEWHTTPFAFPAMRVADLYLLYAEALVENNKLEEAKVWIDKVRKRAGIASVDESWKKYSKQPEKATSKEGIREIVHRERLIELAFEGSRFWDIRRWLEAESYCNQPIQGWFANETTVEAYYQLQTLYLPVFTTKNYLFPIAESEIIKNPNLVQNYGW